MLSFPFCIAIAHRSFCIIVLLLLLQNLNKSTVKQSTVILNAVSEKSYHIINMKNHFS